MLGVSFLNPRQIRRLSLVIFLVSLIMVAATPYFGPEIKGARRWLVLLGINIQPSEFLKPAFVIIVAWLFGESAKRPDMPASRLTNWSAGWSRTPPSTADIKIGLASGKFFKFY